MGSAAPVAAFSLKPVTIRSAAICHIEKLICRIDAHGIRGGAHGDREPRQRSKRTGGRIDAIANDVRARRDIQVGACTIRGDVMAHRQRKWGTAERRQYPASPVDTETRYAWVRGVGVCV